MEALAEAEKLKHAKSDEVCRRAGVSFEVFAMTTFGGMGKEALELLHTVQKRLEEEHGKKEGRRLSRQAVERVAVACARGVGMQLVAAVHGQVPSNPAEDTVAVAHPMDEEAFCLPEQAVLTAQLAHEPEPSICPPSTDGPYGSLPRGEVHMEDEKPSIPIMVWLPSGSLLPWAVPLHGPVSSWKGALLHHCGFSSELSPSFGLAVGHAALDEAQSASFNDVLPGDTLALFRRAAPLQ